MAHYPNFLINEIEISTFSPKNERSAPIKEHPEEYAKRNNTCLLTKEFMTGDVLLFNMYILHGSFENYSKERKIRITCDVRFQLK